MDTDDGGRGSRARDTGSKAIAAIMGAGVGGPAGAVIAVALEPVFVELAARSWEEINLLRRRSAGLMVQRASEEFGGEPEDLVSQAMTDQQSAQLLADAMQAAITTSNEQKIAALGKALANGLRGDAAQVDAERLLVSALAGLEAPHIRVLLHLPSERSRPTSKPSSSAKSAAGRRGMRLTTVATSTGLSPQAATNVMAELVRTGVASRDTYAADSRHDRLILDLQEEVGKLQWQLANATKKPTGGHKPKALKRPGAPVEPGYGRTRFGDLCLEYLDERVPDEAPDDSEGAMSDESDFD